MRKPAFCTCENKDADQLRGKRGADQWLCFRDKHCTIPLLHNSEFSSLWRSSVAAQPGFLSDLVGNPEERGSTILVSHTATICLFVCFIMHQDLIQLTFSLSKLLNIVIPYV